MKRGAVVVACLAGLVLVIGVWAIADLFRTRPVVEGVASRRVEVLELEGVRHPERTEIDAPVPPPPDPLRQDFQRRLVTLRRECGFDSQAVCRDGLCAAFVVAPDLDHILGWAEVATEHPRFVGTTALRQVGVPLEMMPCGAAIVGINVGRPHALGVDRPGGEVWCLVDGRGPHGPSWEQESRALCDAGADALGFDAGRFSSKSVRKLKYDRPD